MAVDDGGCGVEAGGNSHMVIVDSIVMKSHLHMNFYLKYINLYKIRFG